ncbi:Phasin protein [Filomicrobium insigne]|uniref:Phasin protein n=1 Tax=Filomicrobium insigne TaxID=418854 RepID=A0A1H0H5G3_9HYPH|nr:Phasin protein [Filomicrobium insigne]
MTARLSKGGGRSKIEIGNLEDQIVLDRPDGTKPQRAMMNRMNVFTQPQTALFGQQAFLALGRLQGHAFKSMMSYQIEALAFLKHRYEQDVKLLEDLNASKEIDDAVHIYTDFFQNALNDYSSEAGKMANIGSKFASETADRIQREAEALADELSSPKAA